VLAKPFSFVVETDGGALPWRSSQFGKLERSYVEARWTARLEADGVSADVTGRLDYTGSGSVNINVPAGAALRVNVVDTGSGSVNLPSWLKMTAPHYQEVKAPDIPVVTDDDGTQARIVCGSFWGAKGMGSRKNLKPGWTWLTRAWRTFGSATSLGKNPKSQYLNPKQY
jgi:hypothetical protein